MAEPWKKIRLGGLWRAKTGTGKEYFGGGFALGTRIEIWPNTNKRNDKDPDFTLYLVEPPPKDGAGQRAERKAWDTDAQAPGVTMERDVGGDDDSIPF